MEIILELENFRLVWVFGWNYNTTLKNKDCDNGVTRTDSTEEPTYNLNNILWCSLNSPRKKG